MHQRLGQMDLGGLAGGQALVEVGAQTARGGYAGGVAGEQPIMAVPMLILAIVWLLSDGWACLTRGLTCFLRRFSISARPAPPS